ncbi:MAG TPA: energy-coupling factor transporter transmembrane component T, partial [Candidatus Krumholzibacterium sp.]|nr:energy-coupling factor transporter transmembrane component T [Candidatus Krumholzibacterium sp.]
LLRINIFMAVLFLLVPVTWPGREIFSVAGAAYSYEGVMWALAITLKANAIVLVFISLVGTVDPFVLGHAFHHLRMPGKLAHLFMFTLRYADIFHQEHMTLIRAMKARGFRPSMRLHTYKTYADMTGMLLVRSLERSERIMAAMKCRGFTGSFHVVSHFRFDRGDLVFSLICAGVLALLAALALSGTVL